VIDNHRALTARVVGQRIGLSRNAVKRIPPAELPFFRVSSRGDRRYQQADVDAYVARRRES
jgi:hypothetical protein